MSRSSFIDYDRFDPKYCKREIEDLIEKYNTKDPIFEASQGREYIIPHSWIECNLNEMSDDEIIEEYIRLKSLGYFK